MPLFSMTYSIHAVPSDIGQFPLVAGGIALPIEQPLTRHTSGHSAFVATDARNP